MNKILVSVSTALFVMVVGATPNALVAANKLDQKWWADRHQEKLTQIAGLKDRKVDLVFIGDSITHIWESRCPDIIADINRDYTLINLGYSGDKTGNVIWRLEEGGELDGYTAKCVMLMIGTNNDGSDAAEDIAAGIKRILDLIAMKQPQAKTILLPIFPRREWPDGKPHPRPKHDQVNSIIKAYADGQKVIGCDFNAKLLDENNDTLWIMPDRLHPQTAGLEIWYDEVQPLFREICGKTQPEITEGWENIHPGRKAFPSTKPVWKADFSDRGAFVLEKRDGAEGKIDVLGAAIRIRKTNDKGYLLVKDAPFLAPTNTMLQLSADVAVKGATPEYSLGFLRAHGEKERMSLLPEAMSAERVLGWPEMTGLINTAPGMTCRKYACYRSEDGRVRPVIVIAGEPSVSVWSHWVAEDHKAARSLWLKEGRDPEISPKRLKPDLMPNDEFDRMIAADVQHTAKIETVGNGTRLLIEGKPAVPSIYEGMRHLPDYTEINDARGLIKAGVRIAGPIVIGAGGASQSDSVCWSYGKPYDAKKAVDHFRETMRGSGDALMMACYNCNAYPEFTTKEHPEDVWLDQNGEQVVGNWGSSCVGYNGLMDKKNAWPWVSMGSRAWREAICSNIRAFVAELKRRGLDKRLVAIHFSGYNDGQFGMNRPDYSPCAKAEYQRYLKEVEGTGRSTNYWHFCRQMPARVVEEFGRTFKQAMGKDVIVLRRCDSPFVVDFAFGANCRSDGIDITVTGPSYEYRVPAVSCSTFVPFSSMSANNKMLWNEFDLRTWWICQAGSVVANRSNGTFEDIECWRTGYRKLAGEMIAHRGGYWFYDMGRGWFSAPGVSEDVGDSFKIFQKLVDKKPSAWKPDVAIVVDEEGFFGWDGGERDYPGHTYQIVERQIRLLGNAGIPYEYFLAEDVMKHPERLDGKKAVFFMLWRKFDDKRIEFTKRLCEKTPTVVFLSECGSLGGRDEEATGFKIDFSWDAKCFRSIPDRMMKESTLGVMDLEQITGAWFGMNPNKVITPPYGRRGSIIEKPGVVPLARFEDDNSIAIAMRRDGICRRIYISAPGGMSPGFFNRIVRHAGGYAPVNAGCLQVNMNGDFISVHALKAGRYDFKLPFPCKVTNVKSGKEEPAANGILPLNMTAGQTCWFTLDAE